MTVIPIGRGRGVIVPDMRNVAFLFPVVGLFIGMMLAAFYAALSHFIPFVVADAVVLVFYIFLTGGLHIDGLADSCDGIFGGGDRESRLRIMRDSSIGSFGVIALICLVGLKYLCFSTVCSGTQVQINFFTILSDSFVTAHPDIIYILQKCSILVLMPAIGRWAQTFGASIAEYARSDGSGTGRLIIEGSRLGYASCSSGIPFLLTFFLCGLKGLIILAVICVFVLFFVRFIKSRIGGMTGDTLGALNETTELLFLCAFLV